MSQQQQNEFESELNKYLRARLKSKVNIGNVENMTLDLGDVAISSEFPVAANTDGTYTVSLPQEWAKPVHLRSSTPAPEDDEEPPNRTPENKVVGAVLALDLQSDGVTLKYRKANSPEWNIITEKPRSSFFVSSVPSVPQNTPFADYGLLIGFAESYFPYYFDDFVLTGYFDPVTQDVWTYFIYPRITLQIGAAFRENQLGQTWWVEAEVAGQWTWWIESYKNDEQTSAHRFYTDAAFPTFYRFEAETVGRFGEGFRPHGFPTAPNDPINLLGSAAMTAIPRVLGVYKDFIQFYFSYSSTIQLPLNPPGFRPDNNWRWWNVLPDQTGEIITVKAGELQKISRLMDRSESATPFGPYINSDVPLYNVVYDSIVFLAQCDSVPTPWDYEFKIPDELKDPEKLRTAVTWTQETLPNVPGYYYYGGHADILNSLKFTYGANRTLCWVPTHTIEDDEHPTAVVTVFTASNGEQTELFGRLADASSILLGSFQPFLYTTKSGYVLSGDVVDIPPIPNVPEDTPFWESYSGKNLRATIINPKNGKERRYGRLRGDVTEEYRYKLRLTTSNPQEDIVEPGIEAVRWLIPQWDSVEVEPDVFVRVYYTSEENALYRPKYIYTLIASGVNGS